MLIYHISFGMSVNIKLLTIVFAGIILLAVMLYYSLTENLGISLVFCVYALPSTLSVALLRLVSAA